MTSIEALAFQTKHRIVYLALKAIDSSCSDYLANDDGLLYHASPIWRLVDSHIIRISEVPAAVVQEFPNIIRAVQKIHDEARADWEAWQTAKGSGARRSHDDVRNLSEAPQITEATSALLKKWIQK